MKKLLIVAMLASSSALAQTSPQSYTFTVTPADADLISDGLQTQPFGKVYPLINKLREQIIAQQPKPIDPPKQTAPVADSPKAE